MRANSSPHRHDWWVRAAGWIVLSALVGFIVFCAIWRLDGGRWQNVRTASMGTEAPVGSLLWTKPVDFDSLQPGDFISFIPPGHNGQIFSHQVHERNADGTITTKGVIPGPDPWNLNAGDIVGEVRMNWWGVGWLVTAAPFLLVGALIVGLVRTVVSRDWKLPVVITLGALVLTGAVMVYKPLINAQQLAFVPDDNGGATATYVGTGLLPIRLQAVGGEHVDLSAGEVGSVHVDQPDEYGALRVELEPAIPFWWWVILVLICFAPALYSLIVGFPPLPEEKPAEDPDDDGPADEPDVDEDSADVGLALLEGSE